MGEPEMAELQGLLDQVSAPLEPLDIGALDGYLVGVLLQPRAVPAPRWLPLVTDVEGRPVPSSTLNLARLHELVLRRHAELDRAIAERQWFDPWVHELDDDASPSEVVLPWVAGFATAMDAFEGLMALDGPALTEALAGIYQHLDPEDLEDAEDLIAEIETLEPPADLAEAVESLVRSSLLLADVSRPRAPQRISPAAPKRGPAHRRAARPGRPKH